jgi:transcriptional regulator with XRE-family HTH domain/tetratricopeptide (TPR) repeat protein
MAADAVREGKGWMPAPAHAEGWRVAQFLERKIRESGMSIRSIEERAGWSQATLNQILSGRSPIRFSHVAAVCAVVNLPLADFYKELAEEQPSTEVPASGLRVQDLLRELESIVASAHQRLHRPALPGSTPTPEDRQRAGELWRLLADLTEDQQLAVVRVAREFHSWALLERACQESEAQAPRDAKRAAALARLAQEIAERVEGPEGWCKHLRAYAAAFRANALRVGGNLPAADALFAEAHRLWSEAARAGEAPLGYEARILDLESSLRREQRRLKDAAELIDRALALDHCRRGTLLIKKSKLLEEEGDLIRSLALLQEAEPLVDTVAEPRLALILRHNRADYLSKLGRFEEAEALLPEVRTFSRQLNNELDLIRLRWLEARVAAGLGRTVRAIALFKRVRREFTSRGIDYDTALVTLELAILLAKQGRTDEVKELAHQLVPLFEAQKVHREALAALTLFREAAERERVTAELARQLLDFLQRARHDPSLHFERLAGRTSARAAPKRP